MNIVSKFYFNKINLIFGTSIFLNMQVHSGKKKDKNQETEPTVSTVRSLISSCLYDTRYLVFAIMVKELEKTSGSMF